MTVQTQMVLRSLLEEPTQERYGSEICSAAGLPSGTTHPILARLEKLGWLQSYWEDINPATEGRPKRRYYRLSPDGAEQARLALANARNPLKGVATEQSSRIESPCGDYVEVWATDPPEPGTRFQVLRDEWDLKADLPVRTIHEVRVQVERRLS